jgi:hypothetical protein
VGRPAQGGDGYRGFSDVGGKQGSRAAPGAPGARLGSSTVTGTLAHDYDTHTNEQQRSLANGVRE